MESGVGGGGCAGVVQPGSGWELGGSADAAGDHEPADEHHGGWGRGGGVGGYSDRPASAELSMVLWDQYGFAGCDECDASADECAVGAIWELLGAGGDECRECCEFECGFDGGGSCCCDEQHVERVAGVLSDG